MTHVTTLVVVLVLSSAVAFAQPHLNQEQVNLESAFVMALEDTSSEQKLAQVFTPSSDGFVSHLAFAMSCEATADVVVRLEETSGGVPNGVVLGREDVPGTVFTSVPTPAIGFRLVELRHPVRVRAGVQYAVTLESVGGTCGMYVGPAGDSYGGGGAYFDARPNPSGWVELFDDSNAIHDLAFQIYMTARRGR
ncbi:MAG: hypothetical protein ACYC7A_22630 [Thermoanaerobaculia bacterium]